MSLSRKEQRRRIVLLWILLLSVPAWNNAVRLPPQRQRQHPLRPRSFIQCPAVSSCCRGGATNEDAELDAYIEELIASVSDDNDDAAGKEGDAQRTLSDNNSEEEEEDGYASRLETPEVQANVGGTDGIVESETNEHKSGGKKRATPSRKAKRKTTKALTGKSLELRPETVSHSTKRDSNVPVAPSTTGTVADSESTSSRAPQEERSPTPKRPNPLYLFLLRRGRIGHVLVLLLILVVEWIHAYVPPLASLLSWLGSRLLVVAAADDDDQPYRDDDYYLPERSTTTVSSRRTGQTKKQRKALTKQADQVALQQLKMLGNVQQAKYRHVSVDFMMRHGLGAFAPRGVAEREKKEFMVAVVDQQEEEEEDWVVQALTSENEPLESLVGKPEVSVGVGTDGVSVGVEFSVGRRKQTFVEAVKSTPKKKPKRRTNGPRASDRDGGDGIFGRIRAAAGADSLLSRSLLGAYPGDAVPPEEAGSPDGVMALAKKYGWGDWSDDESDDEVSLDPKGERTKKRRRRKRRVTTPTRRSGGSAAIGVEFNIKSGHNDDVPISPRKPTSSSKSRPSSSTRERKVPLSPRSSLPPPSEQTKRKKRRKASRRSSRSTPRPALERINEIREEARASDKNRLTL